MRYGIVFVVLFLSGLVLAEPVLLVSGDDYAPYADSKLPEGGMTTDLVKNAFAAVNTEIKIEWRPWARGLEETRHGMFAGTFPYLKTPEREKDFLYSDVIVKIQDRAFIKAGNNKFDFNNIPSLAGTTICLPLGWTTSPRLNDMIKNEQIKVSRPRDISSCVKIVNAGRADYFVTDETQGIAALKSGGVPAGSMVMAESAPLADNSLYLIAGKSLPGSKGLLENFNKGLAAIRKNGSYDRIFKAHTK
ncbi:MAG: transporter substrate-binding domain-containing protein [Rhodoferax sp.]|nr:transporter substrate-binding domain-containing protein [Rhodoferax sp.]